VLGAIWAGRVFYHVGQTLPGGATTAPATAQVAALQDAFFGLIFMIALALALSIWGFVQERRDQQIPVVVEHKPVA